MNPYVKEYRYYKRYVQGALEQLSDEEFFERPAPGANSAAIILKHLSGNFKSRFTNFLSEDGEKPWRNRESEFDVEGLSRADLDRHWAEAWEVLESNVFDLGPDDMRRTIIIRSEPMSVEAALARSVTHFSFHVGEVVMLARMFRGEDWTFLSVPPGESEAFNASMRQKHAADEG